MKRCHLNRPPLNKRSKRRIDRLKAEGRVRVRSRSRKKASGANKEAVRKNMSNGESQEKAGGCSRFVFRREGSKRNSRRQSNQKIP